MTENNGNFNVNGERAVRLFCSLVETDNPSYGEAQMAKRVCCELESLGLEPRTDETGNVFAYFKGELEGEPTAYSAHLDSVKPATGKCAVRHTDGVITSAGDTVLAADDLAGIAEILEAVRVIKEKNIPHKDIELIFPVCEECYGIGSRAIDYGIIKSRTAYVLDLDGEVGLAAIAAPTILYLKIAVKGRASHAGFAPEAGVNAILAASRAVAGCDFGHIDADTTVNIGKISGGAASNIVSASCELEGEIRGYDDARVMQAAAEMKARFESEAAKLGASVEWHEDKRIAAYSVNENSGIVRRFERACREIDITPKLTRTFGGSDGNVFSAAGIRSIVLACAMNRIHTTDEYTTVSELTRAAELVYRLMTDCQ